MPELLADSITMVIFLSILVTLLLMISIWAVRSRAPDLSEFDLPKAMSKAG